jgi:hypothetical protein
MEIAGHRFSVFHVADSVGVFAVAGLTVAQPLEI